MNDSACIDTVVSLAKAAVERIRWEMEFGVSGYEKSTASSAAAAFVSPIRSKVDLETVPARPSPPIQSPVSPLPAVKPLPTLVVAEEDGELALKALRDALGDCTRCTLHRSRTNLVFGEGNPNAELVFVGEGPGRDEDLSGRPFVGVAGQLLDRIIEAMGLHRDGVYICNVVKCRPPENRTPEESESNICGPFLRRQLAVIRPKVIVALGGTAAAYLLGGPQAITRIRGRFHTVDNIPMMPTFHPAYLLRNPAEKRAVWNDMQLVMDVLGLEKKKK